MAVAGAEEDGLAASYTLRWVAAAAAEAPTASARVGALVE